MKHVGKGAIAFLGSAAFYLFLVGSLEPAETVFACLSGATAAALVLGTDLTARRHLAFDIPPRALLHFVAALSQETLAVAGVLARATWSAPPRGAFVRQPFDYGDETPRSAGRRAISLLGASLAPGSFVIRSDQKDIVLVHSLPPKPPSGDQQWLA